MINQEIESIVVDVLNDEEQKNALEFIAYLKANDMIYPGGQRKKYSINILRMFALPFLNLTLQIVYQSNILRS